MVPPPTPTSSSTTGRAWPHPPSGWSAPPSPPRCAATGGSRPRGSRRQGPSCSALPAWCSRPTPAPAAWAGRGSRSRRGSASGSSRRSRLRGSGRLLDRHPTSVGVPSRGAVGRRPRHGGARLRARAARDQTDREEGARSRDVVEHRRHRGGVVASMHRWWVFLHVAGVFAFLMAHGVSAYVTFKLRSERDPSRVSHLLELSASSVGVMWNSIGVLVVVIVAMYAMGTTWAARLRTISAAMTEGTEAVSSEQFEKILRSRRPYTIAGVGFVGLAVLLWLMLFQPTFGLGGDPCEAASGAASDTVQLCASNEQAFATSSLTAPSGARFELIFDNQDEGVPHNVAIYTDDSATESLFVGDQIVGPDEVTYDVPALDPGSYYFRCDIHPVMDGSLEVG